MGRANKRSRLTSLLVLVLGYVRLSREVEIYPTLTTMKNNNNNKQRRRGPKPRLARDIISHPPQINGLQVVHSTTLRFRVTAAVLDQIITFTNLLDTMLVATTAVAGTDLFQAVRVRRVRLWGMPAVGGAASVYLEYSGTTAGLVGDQNVHTDTSMGVQPAHVDARPGRSSLASEWQINSMNTAFLLSCPAGSVVDVEASFRSQWAPGTNTAAQAALVGATAGRQYLRGLDGLATATSNFVPELTEAQI